MRPPYQIGLILLISRDLNLTASDHHWEGQLMQFAALSGLSRGGAGAEPPCRGALCLVNCHDLNAACCCHIF